MMGGVGGWGGSGCSMLTMAICLRLTCTMADRTHKPQLHIPGTDQSALIGHLPHPFSVGEAGYT